jgi:hypothetical protein
MKGKSIIRIKRLHLFTDGTDICVALDGEDAIRCCMDLTGEDNSEDYGPFYRMPDHYILKIGCEDLDAFDDCLRHSPFLSWTDSNRPGWPMICAPAWVWALQNGRGFLCSSEW